MTLRSISNFISDDGTRDGAYGHERDFGGDIFQNYDEYWKYSPLHYACEREDADAGAAFRQRLSRADRAGRAVVPRLAALSTSTSELVMFPRENHNLTRTGEPKHLVESMNWQVLLVRPFPERQRERETSDGLAVGRNEMISLADR